MLAQTLICAIGFMALITISFLLFLAVGYIFYRFDSQIQALEHKIINFKLKCWRYKHERNR